MFFVLYQAHTLLRSVHRNFKITFAQVNIGPAQLDVWGKKVNIRKKPHFLAPDKIISIVQTLSNKKRKKIFKKKNIQNAGGIDNNIQQPLPSLSGIRIRIQKSDKLLILDSRFYFQKTMSPFPAQLFDRQDTQFIDLLYPIPLSLPILNNKSAVQQKNTFSQGCAQKH